MFILVKTPLAEGYFCESQVYITNALRVLEDERCHDLDERIQEKGVPIPIIGQASAHELVLRPANKLA